MKKYKFLFLFILVLLIIFAFMISPIYIIFGNNIVKSVEGRFGSNYAKVLNYQYVKIGSMNILDVDYYKPKDLNLPSFKGKTTLATVENIINFMDTIPYTNGQNNPNDYKSGLNCQGYSLLFQNLCSKYNIKCIVEHTTDHMYNIVTIDNRKYKVDITNKIMEEV